MPNVFDDLILEENYYIENVVFNQQENYYTIIIKNDQKVTACPVCLAQTTIYDHLPREWRHLNFQDSKVYINFEVPRAKCSTHGILQTKINWARPRQHYTISLEKLVCEQARDKSLLQIAKELDEHDTRIRRIVRNGEKNEKNN